MISKLQGKVNDQVLIDYPYELLEKRELLEMSYVFCLWKNPEFYDEYADINPHNDLITFDGQFFFDIGYAMKELKVKVIDDNNFIFLTDK